MPPERIHVDYKHVVKMLRCTYTNDSYSGSQYSMFVHGCWRISLSTSPLVPIACVQHSFHALTLMYCIKHCAECYIHQCA